MKNLTDWFDRVYVINCAHRPDRLVETKRHLDETKMADNDKVIYYPAIIGDWTTCPADWGSGRGAWGCIFPDTKVQGRISSASKARYSGNAVHIVTRGGEEVTLTVNHPILTKKGFVRAGDFHEGMDLLCYVPDVEASPPCDDVKDEPPTAREVFDALTGEGYPTHCKSSTSLDFYGDGESIHGDIEIVDIDGPLLDPLTRPNTESPKKGKFTRGHLNCKSKLTHFSPRDLAGPHVGFPRSGVSVVVPPHLSGLFNRPQRDGVPPQNTSYPRPKRSLLRREVPRRILKFFREVFDSCALFVFRNNPSLFAGTQLASVGHPHGFNDISEDDSEGFQFTPQRRAVDSETFSERGEALPRSVTLPKLCQHVRGKFVGKGHFYGFGSASKLDTCFDKFAFDDVDAETSFYGDLTERNPRVVKVDEVASVKRFHYDGDVFDFGTTVGHFTASNSERKGESGVMVSNCLRSHQRILEDVIQDRDERGRMNCDNVLIMEDDVIFKDNPLERLNNFMEAVPEDWGQIYLGGQHRRPPKKTEDPNVIIGSSVNRTHAYAVNQPTLTALYRHISYATDYRGSSKHIDHQLELAHRRADWPVYCPKEWIVGQRAGSSNISGKTNETKFW